ncbi:hypothetical protein IFO68_05610 [Photobacterium sp. CAU 1568]|uniref:Uncharacterized protein n=1 Tax=Photobacterium arenosum TaxID=2774143 RepID=A0ABR9BHX4_9GAMM|nr:hypothetical protein [Photobacterium arenosum]MBD8512162.1 hypothetical protein [Photobacterium arenosum]
MLKLGVIILLITAAVAMARFLDERNQKKLYIGMLICAVIAIAVFMATELAR